MLVSLSHAANLPVLEELRARGATAAPVLDQDLRTTPSLVFDLGVGSRFLTQYAVSMKIVLVGISALSMSIAGQKLLKRIMR